MKAAVVYQMGEMPQYADFPEPIVHNDDEVLITVKASAIKQLDKSRASGKHYSATADKSEAIVPGGDGVGLLEDGTRVFAMGISGMMAEKAVVDRRRMVKLPDGIDDATAAALPNGVAGSVMALRFRAGMKVGETILINGATGFTGRIAIQVAKHYGAKKIIVTLRNEKSLKYLLELGADIIVSTEQTDENFINQLKEIHNHTPIDIVIDYLWGHTAELILEAFKGEGSFTQRTRFVSIGSISGDKIQLSSEILRSVDLQISGSGLGSWTKEEMYKLIKEIIPEMLQLAADKKIIIETEKVNLKDIKKLWGMTVADGKRLVVTI
ncbi:zinc-binding alcohol dehydrogenase family protein [Agrobacterium tumefaciens]|nr:zinc-binding alcohol dehydrogenase family protein [Agrobacterium tumefaciens]NTE22238.1 zinc-binding alcohol dehydrogenase family protein [Agrobacterium tumefaciens]